MESLISLMKSNIELIKNMGISPEMFEENIDELKNNPTFQQLEEVYSKAIGAKVVNDDIIKRSVDISVLATGFYLPLSYFQKETSITKLPIPEELYTTNEDVSEELLISAIVSNDHRLSQLLRRPYHLYQSRSLLLYGSLDQITQSLSYFIPEEILAFAIQTDNYELYKILKDANYQNMMVEKNSSLVSGNVNYLPTNIAISSDEMDWCITHNVEYSFWHLYKTYNIEPSQKGYEKLLVTDLNWFNRCLEKFFSIDTIIHQLCKENKVDQIKIYLQRKRKIPKKCLKELSLDSIKKLWNDLYIDEYYGSLVSIFGFQTIMELVGDKKIPKYLIESVSKYIPFNELSKYDIKLNETHLEPLIESGRTDDLELLIKSLESIDINTTNKIFEYYTYLYKDKIKPSLLLQIMYKWKELPSDFMSNEKYVKTIASFDLKTLKEFHQWINDKYKINYRFKIDDISYRMSYEKEKLTFILTNMYGLNNIKPDDFRTLIYSYPMALDELASLTGDPKKVITSNDHYYSKIISNGYFDEWNDLVNKYQLQIDYKNEVELLKSSVGYLENVKDDDNYNKCIDYIKETIPRLGEKRKRDTK